MAVIFGILSLLLTIAVFVQRRQIVELQSQLLNSHQRTKRDVIQAIDGPEKFYFPLYTQLSAKSLEKICAKQWKPNRDRNRTKMKKCGRIQAASMNPSIWHRPFKVGSAIECGQSRLITEYESGYTLFEYSNGEQNYPISIHTLPEPYQGTDHTAYCANNRTTFIYYSEGVGWKPGSIIKLDMQTGTHIRASLNASELPLYNSYSSVDLEIDEGGWLWAIYRLPVEKKIAVSKFELSRLRQVGGWLLDDQRMENASGAFVSCGVLYSINRESTNSYINAVYDFKTNSYLHVDAEIKWKSNESHFSSRFDSSKDVLNVFENGRIYSVQMYRS